MAESCCDPERSTILPLLDGMETHNMLPVAAGSGGGTRHEDRDQSDQRSHRFELWTQSTVAQFNYSHQFKTDINALTLVYVFLPTNVNRCVTALTLVSIIIPTHFKRVITAPTSVCKVS